MAMRHRTFFFLACLLLSAPVALADDGIDPTPKPASCIQVDLSGSNDYKSGPPGDVSECVDGAGGQNTIWTFGGKDWGNGKGDSDPMYMGDGQDVAYGGNDGDSIHGEGGDDNLYAGCPGGCDQSGQPHFNDLYGDAGDDRLAMRNNVGQDEAHCGSGFDVVYLDTKDIKKNGEYDTADGSCEDVRRG